jgi:anti-sigma factor (TIGR02949 family)
MTTSARVRLEALGLSAECVEVMQHLWDFLDEELTPEGAKRLQTHLTECEQCRGYGDYQSCFFDALAKLKANLDAPSELRDKLAETLRREGCGCWEKARTLRSPSADAL